MFNTYSPRPKLSTAIQRQRTSVNTRSGSMHAASTSDNYISPPYSQPDLNSHRMEAIALDLTDSRNNLIHLTLVEKEKGREKSKHTFFIHESLVRQMDHYDDALEHIRSDPRCTEPNEILDYTSYDIEDLSQIIHFLYTGSLGPSFAPAERPIGYKLPLVSDTGKLERLALMLPVHELAEEDSVGCVSLQREVVANIRFSEPLSLDLFADFAILAYSKFQIISGGVLASYIKEYLYKHIRDFIGTSAGTKLQNCEGEMAKLFTAALMEALASIRFIDRGMAGVTDGTVIKLDDA
ncbi:hypothetical protein LTR66_000359 [Elasticomyces elasticus]|nr:hypothetical protein LTR66_000359 [Elasticomyces elasticus]